VSGTCTSGVCSAPVCKPANCPACGIFTPIKCCTAQNTCSCSLLPLICF
jgi:hypothetical protein